MLRLDSKWHPSITGVLGSKRDSERRARQGLSASSVRERWASCARKEQLRPPFGKAPVSLSAAIEARASRKEASKRKEQARAPVVSFAVDVGLSQPMLHYPGLFTSPIIRTPYSVHGTGSVHEPQSHVITEVLRSARCQVDRHHDRSLVILFSATLSNSKRRTEYPRLARCSPELNYSHPGCVRYLLTCIARPAGTVMPPRAQRGASHLVAAAWTPRACMAANAANAAELLPLLQLS